jgi:type III pantothenate kinase
MPGTTHAPLPPDLILDVGNSRTKLAIFSTGGGFQQGVMRNGDKEALLAFLHGTVVGRVGYGSVAATDDRFVTFLRSLAPVTILTGASDSPLRNAYTTTGTLGVDRLANAVAAWQAHAGTAVLAVDMGTCITYDLVDEHGAYQGGAISPGLRMRAQAMHAYSARLPLVVPAPVPDVVGRSTQASLESGVHYGVAWELEGYVKTLRQQRPQLLVVLTGGDSGRFGPQPEIGIFADPFLTLRGLHALLEHRPAVGDAYAPSPRY